MIVCMYVCMYVCMSSYVCQYVCVYIPHTHHTKLKAQSLHQYDITSTPAHTHTHTPPVHAHTKTTHFQTHIHTPRIHTHTPTFKLNFLGSQQQHIISRSHILSHTHARTHTHTLKPTEATAEVLCVAVGVSSKSAANLSSNPCMCLRVCERECVSERRYFAAVAAVLQSNQIVKVPTQCIATHGVLQCVAQCISALESECCRVLQCVAVCCRAF